MRINYSKAIAESEEDLTELEQRLRGQKAADRVRMLRLLKSGTVNSMKDCAPLLGYSLVQLTRWWERCRRAGLAELIKQQKPVGQTCKVTAEAWEGLLAAMRKGHMATMEDARDYPRARVGDWVQERQVVVVALQKTSSEVEDGRRRHKKANAEQQAAFKKASEA
jgi:hypothetical protein